MNEGYGNGKQRCYDKREGKLKYTKTYQSIEYESAKGERKKKKRERGEAT